MKPKLWRQAQEIFERAIDAPAGERAVLVAAACAANPELRAAVEGLLASDERTQAILDSPPLTALRDAVDEEIASHWIGRTLGPYRILEKIGQGGMGQVFLGERDDDAFAKQVAIKILSAATPSTLERFHRERQILADLEHPGIARLIDGGTTPDGLPYVVMELIAGHPLGDYCTENALGIEARLALFVEVCEAVGHAHRSLIVHRDLKPSNVLVTPDGHPKLLDFGIAKLLDDPPGGAATEAADRAMTPDYASPEQLVGGAITTASDVYSLGVILHELLTGSVPFRRSGLSALEAERSVETARLRPPSALLEAEPRDALPLSPRDLEGDLDNILLKALQNSPSQRYSSVEALVADLDNFRLGLPVSARAPTLGYRAGKFLRRNSLPVAIATAVVAMILAFTILTVFQARRVQQEKEVAEDALAFLVTAFENANPRVSRGAEVTASHILDEGIRALGEDEDLSPQVRAVMMHTIGQVQLALGKQEEARVSLTEALRQTEALSGQESPELGPILCDLATALLGLSEFSAAEGIIARALDLLPPDEPVLRIRALHALGEVHGGLSRFEAFVEHNGTALELARQLLSPAHPQLVASLRSRARALEFSRDLEGADALRSEALALQEEYRPGDQSETATLLVGLGTVARRRGDFATAETHLRAGLEMRRRIYGDDHWAVGRSLNELARALAESGDAEAAAASYRQSLAIYEGALGPDSLQTIGVRRALAEHLHQGLGSPAEAEGPYRAAVASYQGIEGRETSPNLSRVFKGLAAVLDDLGRHAEAEAFWRDAIAIWERRDESLRDRALEAQLGLADCLAAQGDVAPAETIYAALWTAGAEVGVDEASVQQAGRRLIESYVRSGRPEQAAAIRQALDSASSTETSRPRG